MRLPIAAIIAVCAAALTPGAVQLADKHAQASCWEAGYSEYQRTYTFTYYCTRRPSGMLGPVEIRRLRDIKEPRHDEPEHRRP